MLILIGSKIKIKFADNSLFAVLQADGTINRFLDRFSDNLADWLKYLGVTEHQSSFRNLLNHEINLLTFCLNYVDYIQEYVKTKKDKIPISDSSQEINATSFNSEQDAFSNDCINQITKYIKFISDKTGWSFNQNHWQFNNFKILRFTKETVKPGVATYKNAIENNPISMAFTSSQTFDYTLEGPDKLFD